MGRNKKYGGYRAFQYLEPGFDYKEFKLCKELNRVPPYIVPLSKTGEERFEKFVENNILISLQKGDGLEFLFRFAREQDLFCFTLKLMYPLAFLNPAHGIYRGISHSRVRMPRKNRTYLVDRKWRLNKNLQIKNSRAQLK